jgi:hypothetical protein
LTYNDTGLKGKSKNSKVKRKKGGIALGSI